MGAWVAIILGLIALAVGYLVFIHPPHNPLINICIGGVFFGVCLLIAFLADMEEKGQK